jgi:hypothetical protein
MIITFMIINIDNKFILNFHIYNLLNKDFFHIEFDYQQK